MKVWTDGSCIGNPGPGAWAAYFENGAEIVGEDPKTTNNRMEMMAIYEAIKAAPSDEILEVFSDSQWCVKVLNFEYTPKKNLDLIQKIHRLVNDRYPEVTFFWIPGHAGNEGNERANQLAQKAARKLASRG